MSQRTSLLAAIVAVFLLIAGATTAQEPSRDAAPQRTPRYQETVPTLPLRTAPPPPAHPDDDPSVKVAAITGLLSAILGTFAAFVLVRYWATPRVAVWRPRAWPVPGTARRFEVILPGRGRRADGGGAA